MIGVRRPSVRLSDVAYIGSNSKTKRPRKTKVCTGVPQVTCDSHTDFKVKSQGHGAGAYCGGHVAAQLVTVVIRSQIRKNLTDSRSLFHFAQHCRIGRFPRFISISHTVTGRFSGLSKMTDTNKRLNPRHFGAISRTPGSGSIKKFCFESWITFARGQKQNLMDLTVFDVPRPLRWRGYALWECSVCYSL